MHYGPCGGVRDDLSCELGDRPCPFAVGPLPPWTGGEPGARAAAAAGRAAGPRRHPARGAHRPVGHALRAGLGAAGRRGARGLVGRPARRRAPEHPGPAAHPVRRRGARRRRPPVDHADLPRPQPRRAGAGDHGARRGRGRGRAVRDRGRPRARRASRRHPGLRPRRHPARRPGRRGGAGRDRPGGARGRAAGGAARPGGGQAARRGPAVRAEPHEQPGGRRPLRGRGPAARARRCRSSRGSRCTPTSSRPGSCRPSRGCTSTTPRSRRCSRPRTRWRRGSRPRSSEARALLAIPGVVGVNLSGLASGRGEVAGAEVKAAIAEGIRRAAG